MSNVSQVHNDRYYQLVDLLGTHHNVLVTELENLHNVLRDRDAYIFQLETDIAELEEMRESYEEETRGR